MEKKNERMERVAKAIYEAFRVVNIAVKSELDMERGWEDLTSSEQNLILDTVPEIVVSVGGIVDPFIRSVVDSIGENSEEKLYNILSPTKLKTGTLIELLALNQEFGVIMFGHDRFISIAGQLKGAIDSAGVELAGGAQREGNTESEAASGESVQQDRPGG